MKNGLIFQNLIGTALCAFLLVGCADVMPTKPEGMDLANMTNIGNQLRQRGDDVGAAEFYQRALLSKPDDVVARRALGEILEAHGHNVEAANQYRAAIQVAPQEGEWHRALGRVLIKLNRPDEAKNHYQQALQIDDRDVKALNGLGISLDYLGQHDAAQKAYKEALDVDSKDLATLNNLAHSYVMVGGYQDAIKLLEPHVKAKNATPALRQNLAEAYGMAGMKADAERVARMDLAVTDVKRNLDYYQKRRAQLSPEPKFFADLGSFATKGMADARAEQVKTTFAKEIEGLILSANSDVKQIGGTPSFSVQVTGFLNKEKLKTFCEKLTKENIACKPRGV